MREDATFLSQRLKVCEVQRNVYKWDFSEVFPRIAKATISTISKLFNLGHYIFMCIRLPRAFRAPESRAAIMLLS